MKKEFSHFERANRAGKQHVAAGGNESDVLTASMPFGGILSIHRSAGNQAVQRLFESRRLQAKLGMNAPDDRYEQEADRVSGQVMRMPAPALQLKPG